MAYIKFLSSIVVALGLFISPVYGQSILDAPGGQDTALTGAEAFMTQEGTTGNYVLLSQIDGYVGAGGQSIVNDITEAPYNATCNGVADDSNAFELAVDTGGTFFLPPGARCWLKSTNNYNWGTDTTFYGLAGAENDTHIDIDVGSNFLLTGGSVRLYNLTFKNGDDFIFANGLAGTVSTIECVNTIWDNVNTACVRYSTTGPNVNSVVERFVFKDSKIHNNADGFNLFFFGPFKFYNVSVINNRVIGGRRGLQVGFMDNPDPTAELDERKRVIMSHNHVSGIDGLGTGGPTVSCIFINASYVNISDNICEDIDDTLNNDNIECIYTKARYMIVVDNVMRNCGRNQGGIALKGDASADIDNCTIGACGRHAIVMGNIVQYDKADEGGYNCVWVQSSDIIISNNIFEGCTERAIKVTNAGNFNNIQIKNNHFYNIRGSDGINVQGDHDNVEIVGNTFSFDTDVGGTYNAVNIDVGGGQTARYIRIAGNRFLNQDIAEGDIQRGIELDIDGTAEYIEIKDNYFMADLDVALNIIGTGTIDVLIIGMNEMLSVQGYTEVGGGTIIECTVYNNSGFVAEGSCPVVP